MSFSLQHHLLKHHRPAGEPPPVEEPIVEGVSFQDDIQPILAEECAIAGCHAAPGAAGLDLTKYDTFKKGGNTGARIHRR